MTTGLQVPRLELEEWLGELKTYQRTTMQIFLADANPEEAAEKWISATGSKNIAPFGGTRDPKPFWDRFCEEFHKFICDDSAYVEERKALLSKGQTTARLLMMTISSAVGATIGYSATLLIPAVAVLLYTVGRIGRNAYCKDQ